MLLPLLVVSCVWGSSLESNGSLSHWAGRFGLTEKVSSEELGENKATLNWRKTRSNFRLIGEKRSIPREKNVDTKTMHEWEDKHRARSRMLGIALELERKFYPRHLSNSTLSFVVDRREEIETETNFSDSLESINAQRMLINSLYPPPKKAKEEPNSVYDLLLVDGNGDEDDEARKERELKRLEEIQEQRRIRMEHDSDKYGTRHMGEYAYLLPIEWMLDRGGVPYPPGYYPINLYDLIIDNDPSLNLSLVPQRDGLPRRKDQVQLRYLPANLRAALIPLAFTSMDVVSLLLLMVGWFLLLLCTAALIGIQAETHAATRCVLNISKNLIYQREIKRDPSLTDRLKEQAEETGITPNTWHYLVLRKKDIGDDVFNRIALCIQHYFSFYNLIKRWEALKNSDNKEIAKAAIALMDDFLTREHNYISAKQVGGSPETTTLHWRRDWQHVSFVKSQEDLKKKPNIDGILL